MANPVRILLFGAGNRGSDVYGRYALNHPNEVKFVAVAEPHPQRRVEFARAHHIQPAYQFEDWFEAIQAGKIADAVINATQDEMHHNSTIAALQMGYDILLEKPIATTLSETVHIVHEAQHTERLLMVCHVLRYTDFFQKIKAIFDSGRLGQIIHIAHAENVSYFHMAHSYVRGNWRTIAECAPMIVAKCCHDLDLLYWFLGEKPAYLSSFGNLSHFKAENAPPGAPHRCTDGCPAAVSCPFYAPRIYLENFPVKAAVAQAENLPLRFIGRAILACPRWVDALGVLIPPLRKLTRYSGWPRNTLTEFPESDEAVLEALLTGPYGRCVYHCDNDVVDHQIVSLAFDSGITATLTMHGHSHEEGRTLRVDGSHATLLGKFGHSQAWIEVHPHGPGPVERCTFPTVVDNGSGHGGGDEGVMRAFVQALRGTKPPLTDAQDALESHFLAFAAEAARLAGVSIDMADFRQKVAP
jgi:predicted dehydrogenase